MTFEKFSSKKSYKNSDAITEDNLQNTLSTLFTVTIFFQKSVQTKTVDKEARGLSRVT